MSAKWKSNKGLTAGIILFSAAAVAAGVFMLLNISLHDIEIVKSREDIISLAGAPTRVEVFTRRGVFRFPENSFSVELENTNLVRIIRDEHSFYLVSLSVTNSGGVRLTVTSGGKKWEGEFSLTVPADDADDDGYPDVLRVGRTGNFRDWFCMIADSQFYYPAGTWYDVHKDCSGLLEFAYREAMKKHDTAWAKSYKVLSDFNIDDTRPYYYPDVPFIGRRLFRVREGGFDPAQVSNDFSETASGTALRSYSMAFVGRDFSGLEKGDMLFFFHQDNLKMPSHSMIYLGTERSADKLDGCLVYHTGPGEKSKGFMKKVTLRDLVGHPDQEWRPVPENPAFSGIYRWKILK